MRSASALALLVLALAGLLAWLSVDGAPAAAGAVVESTFEHDAPSEAVLTLGEDVEAESETSERSAEAGVATALAGRVLHATTGEPLAGFEVVARSGRDWLAADESDERGRFALRDVTFDRVSLSVTTPYGWAALDTPRKVARDERGEFPRVEILARESGFAPFRARLTNAETGERVPHYLVRIGTQQGSRESAWSDAEGLMLSEQKYPEGALMLFGYDIVPPNTTGGEAKPHWYREVRHVPVDGEAAELDLAIAVGPTYHLDLDAPEDARRSPLFAAMARSGPFLPAPVRADSVSQSPLRWNDGCWVRFAPQMRIFGAGRNALAVASLDGRWYGEGTISTHRGIAPERVPITLLRRARLLGRAVDERGEGVARAHVTIYRRQGADWRSLSTAETAANGLFDFPFAPAGTYLARGVSMGNEPAEAIFEAADGIDAEFELLMRRVSALGEVSGVITAPEEVELEDAFVVLSSVRVSGRTQTQTPKFERSGGRQRAEFRFVDVPVDDYELRVSAYGDVALSVRPESLEFTAPREHISIEIERTSNPDCFSVRARDARTDKVLDWATLEVLAKGIESESSRLRVENTMCVTDARRAAAEWIVWREGYVPVRGLVSQLPFSGDRAEISVALQPGWGAELEVLGPGFTPLEGAQVWIDGKPAGTADARGRLSLAREAAPGAFDLRYRDWRVELDSQPPLEDLRAGAAAYSRLWMRPP